MYVTSNLAVLGSMVGRFVNNVPHASMSSVGLGANSEYTKLHVACEFI